LAILAFDATGDLESEVFAEGLGENLIRALSRTRVLRVVPPASSFRFMSSNPDIRGMAKQLSVRYLLTGSTRTGDSRVRVGVQLVDAARNVVVWSETYDRPRGDAMDIEEQIANAVPAHLGTNLAGFAAQDSERPNNYEAYNAYLHGRYHLNRRQTPSLRLAQNYFEKAIAADPSMALAHTGLAETLLVMAERGVTPASTALPMAEAAARRSLTADPRLADAYAVLGFAVSVNDHDFVAAEQNFKRALALNPELVVAHQWYSYMLMKLSRFDEAIAHGRRALEIDPLSMPAHQNLAAVYCYGRNALLLEEESRKLLELDPNHYFAHMFLAYAAVFTGRAADADRELAAGLEGPSSPPNVVRMAGEIYALMNRRQEATAHLAKLLEMRSQGEAVPSSYPGFLYAALADRDNAFTWLEQAWREQDPFLTLLGVYPACDSLRADVRYLPLLDRLGITGNMGRH
jgi:serine/threonine-protein kinase